MKTKLYKRVKQSKALKRAWIVLFFSLVFSVTLYATESVHTKEWYSIFFTNPRSGRQPSGPEQALVKLINSAQNYFFGSFYEISSEKIIRALHKARQRGISVKLVIENSNFHEKGMYSLYKAGVPIVTDNRGGLMHNKFAIVDGTTVWTGSYNVTYNGSHKNNNNAILIRSRACAQIYLKEFTEQFNNNVFGNKRDYGPFVDLTKKNYFSISNSDVYVYFAPEDPVEDTLLRLIGAACRSVDFMAYSFTSDRLGELLIRKNKKGVIVRGLFEKNGTNSEYSQFYKMKVSGLQVLTDRNRGLMHHKVFIIDDSIVVTGSYNFSKNASLVNDENVLIIYNRDIARQYKKEFMRLFR